MEAFSETIRAAAASGTALRIRGGGSKDFYGNTAGDGLRGEILDTRGYSGVVSYEPSELVLTARCGTLLSDLDRILSGNGQFLSFEPPSFGPGATLGGCIAAGLSGPRRASAGSVRDAILGVKLVDGKGEVLSFGGQVMKNVAGYDVSRMLAGSLGTLGVIAEVSLKLLPLPPVERTLAFEMPQRDALEALRLWGGQPLPVSASAWQGGRLSVRLSGAPSAVDAAAKKLGGQAVGAEEGARYWTGVREQTDAFFAGEAPLWRLSLPAQAPELGLAGEPLVEWSGALRWLRSSAPASEVRAAAAALGGHATLFRAADKSAGAFTPLPPLLARLHRDLKKTFDPAGILNPGRLYPEF